MQSVAKHCMAVPERLRSGATRPDVAPALFRLLAEAALSRAALDACGLPVALADAAAARPAFSYVNHAFETCFGYRAAEVLGRPAAELLHVDAAAADEARVDERENGVGLGQRDEGSAHEMPPERLTRTTSPVVSAA